MSRGLTLTCACVAVLVAACGRWTPDRFEGQVTRSPHFEYHDQGDEAQCPGLTALLELHVEVVGNAIGMGLGTDAAPFRYYRYLDPASVGAPGALEGFCDGRDVFSEQPFDEHELAHAYVNRAWGNSGARGNGLLAEGTAVSLSCDPPAPVSPTSYDWRRLLNLQHDSLDGYSIAGRFVTWLLQEYGVERFGRLYRAVAFGIDATDFEREFARIYPTSMDSAWRSAQGTDFVYGWGNCRRDWMCWVDGRMNVGGAVASACDGGIHRSLLVEAGQTGTVLQKTGADIRVWRDCLADSMPYVLVRDVIPYDNAGVHWMELAPGSYTVTGSGSATVTVTSMLSQPLFGATCDSPGEVTLDSVRSTEIDLPGRDGVNGWIRLITTDQNAYDVVAILPFADQLDPGHRSVSICDSCDPSATCRPLLSGASQALSLPSGSLLRFQNVDGREDVPPQGVGVWFRPTPPSGAEQ